MNTTVKKSVTIVALWLATGSAAQLFGAFAPRMDVPGFAVAIDHYCAAADLNQDGLADIVTTAHAGNGGLFLLQQNCPATPTPTFTLVVIDPILPGAAEVSVADLNGDCKLDVVVSDGSALSWYENWGPVGCGATPIFMRHVLSSISQGCADENHDLVDIDQDGDLDIVASCLAGLWLFKNMGGGTFDPGAFLGSFGVHSTFGHGDFDNDGDVDLAAASTGVAYWLENISGNFTTIHVLKTGPFHGLRVTDLDQNCQPDILLNVTDNGLNPGTPIGELRWFHGFPGTVTETLLQSGTDMGSWNNIVIKDFDGDGDLDIVGGGTRGASSGFVHSQSGVIFLRNNGTPGNPVFPTKLIIGTLFDSESFAVADLDGDCDPDVIAAGFTSGTVGFFLNTFNFGCLCPLGRGYWKNHPCLWPEASLTLGKITYTRAELVAILTPPPPPPPDASIILARQLIAAKLNIASGSDPAPISTTILSADNLLCPFSGKLPYNIGPLSASWGPMVTLANILGNYNSGLLTPNCVPR